MEKSFLSEGGEAGPGSAFWGTEPRPEPRQLRKQARKPRSAESCTSVNVCEGENSYALWTHTDTHPWRSRCCRWGWRSSFQVGEFHIYCKEGREDRRVVSVAGLRLSGLKCKFSQVPAEFKSDPWPPPTSPLLALFHCAALSGRNSFRIVMKKQRNVFLLTLWHRKHASTSLENGSADERSWLI